MRRFHSYGPVNCKHHFCVKRRELIENCLNYLISNTEYCGHYFTIWAPRQSGKTWLMGEEKRKLRNDTKCMPDVSTAMKVF